jgi:hypothetical protein
MIYKDLKWNAVSSKDDIYILYLSRILFRENLTRWIEFWDHFENPKIQVPLISTLKDVDKLFLILNELKTYPRVFKTPKNKLWSYVFYELLILTNELETDNFKQVEKKDCCLKKLECDEDCKIVFALFETVYNEFGDLEILNNWIFSCNNNTHSSNYVDIDKVLNLYKLYLSNQLRLINSGFKEEDIWKEIYLYISYRTTENNLNYTGFSFLMCLLEEIEIIDSVVENDLLRIYNQIVRQIKTTGEPFRINELYRNNSFSSLNQYSIRKNIGVLLSKMKYPIESACYLIDAVDIFIEQKEFSSQRKFESLSLGEVRLPSRNPYDYALKMFLLTDVSTLLLKRCAFKNSYEYLYFFDKIFRLTFDLNKDILPLLPTLILDEADLKFHFEELLLFKIPDLFELLRCFITIKNYNRDYEISDKTKALIGLRINNLILQGNPIINIESLKHQMFYLNL